MLPMLSILLTITFTMFAILTLFIMVTKLTTISKGLLSEKFSLNGPFKGTVSQKFSLA